MKMLIEETPNILIMSLILSAFFILVVVLVVIYAVSRAEDTKHIDKVEDLSSSVRIYVLDLKNDTVKYFNRSSLKAIKTSSIIDFYNQFKTSDRIKLINWVGTLLDEDIKTTNYLEINVLERRRKRTCYSILQVQKVDYDNKIIHLESYLLRLQNERKQNRINVAKFSNEEAFNNAISSSKSKKGATIAINFYYKNPDQRRDDFPRLIFAQIKNVMMNYVNSNRPILEYNSHELIISDLRVQNKTQILSLVAQLKNDINRLLMITSHNEDILYSIVIVENRYFPHEVDKIISSAVQIAEFSEEEEGQQIIWYEPGKSFETSIDQNAYRTEVERIISDNKFRFTYRAIYDAEHAKILGYQAFITPTDSFFESITELKNYSIKTGDDRELFSTITKRCLNRFIQEKDGVSLRIFYPITYKERHYVIRTLSYIQKIKETHVVIVFNELDMVSMVDIDEDEIISTLRSMKSKGYEVAMQFQNNDMPFSRKVYSQFDFFLIDIGSTLFDRFGNKNLSILRGFAEKLIHYHKIIIATDIPSWDSVELMIRLGLALVSSDSISPVDEMILPISQKSANKIKKVVQSQGDIYGK